LGRTKRLAFAGAGAAAGAAAAGAAAGAAGAAGVPSTPWTGPKPAYPPSEVQLACAATKGSTPFDARNSSFASTLMSASAGSCMKAQACATVIVPEPAATACILMLPPRDRQALGFNAAAAQSLESFAPALASSKVVWMRSVLVCGDSLGKALGAPANAVCDTTKLASIFLVGDARATQL